MLSFRHQILVESTFPVVPAHVDDVGPVSLIEHDRVGDLDRFKSGAGDDGSGLLSGFGHQDVILIVGYYCFPIG